jgi:hypothetical protein
MREGAIGASGLEDLLAGVDVRTGSDIAVRRIGGKAELAGFIAGLQAPANSDYHPYVDQNAVRRRFMRTDATAIGELGPVNRRLAPRPLAPGPRPRPRSTRPRSARRRPA